jgi:hypothetical protein
MCLQPLATKLLNVIIYQVGWFCCVLGAGWGFPIAGALIGLLLAGLHLLLAVSRKKEALLMLSACLLGTLIDSIQTALGLFSFTRDPAWPLWLPLWVFVIWAQFATLFHYGLHWLSGRYALAAILGLAGGPLAYWAGIRVGAASFGPNPLLTIVTLAIVWAFVTPVLCRLSDFIDREEGRYRLGRGK